MSYRYILFNKPYGVLSQFTDSSGEKRKVCASGSPGAKLFKRRTLKDYISVTGVYPVGRLDWDSEGLMLLTDNGQLQHKLSHPQFGHSRTYLVQVERIPDSNAIQQLQAGVIISDRITRPAIVKLLTDEPFLPEREVPIRFRKNIPTAWLEMTLTEGRNRQVRRMTAKVGFPTLRLVRVAISHLSLHNLQPGYYRNATEKEVKNLLK